MNRSEFCKLLAVAKANSSITTTDLSFSIKMLLPTLRRFEKGEHNFKVDKAMSYLSIVKARVLLYKGNKRLYLSSYEDVIAFIKKAREGVYTQRELAQKVGCTHATIANIERNTNIVSIDTFLKILEALGYELKIESL